MCTACIFVGENKKLSRNALSRISFFPHLYMYICVYNAYYCCIVFSYVASVIGFYGLVMRGSDANLSRKNRYTMSYTSVFKP